MTLTMQAFQDGIRQPEVVAYAAGVIDQLSADPSLEDYRASLHGIVREGRGYWDLACALSYLAESLPLRDYLEIGVRRGKSMAQVAVRRPSTRIIGCDLWISPYGGVESPGPPFVQDELARLGYGGPITLLSGDSHDVLPRWCTEHPHERFDLVTVDGDHTDDGAWADLELAASLVRPGGFLVFDDIVHPACPLERVWTAFREKYEDSFEFAENLADHNGTGVARRRELAA